MLSKESGECLPKWTVETYVNKRLQTKRCKQERVAYQRNEGEVWAAAADGFVAEQEPVAGEKHKVAKQIVNAEPHALLIEIMFGAQQHLVAHFNHRQLYVCFK